MSPTCTEFTWYRKEKSGRSLRLTTRLQLSNPLFANLKILDVFGIYPLQVSSFMYLDHHDAFPSIAFTQIFQTGNQIHQCSARYSDFYTYLVPVEQILKNF